MFKTLQLAACSVVLVCLAATSMAQTSQPKLSEALLRASETFKIKLLEQTYTLGQAGGRVFEGAVISGFEKTPATQYGSGVDYAIVRFSSAELKDGYYKARIIPSGPITKVGKTKITVQLIDSNGKIVHSNPSAMTVFSLTLPVDSAEHAPILELSSRMDRKSNLSAASFDNIQVTAVVCCKNGTCGQCIGNGCPAN